MSNVKKVTTTIPKDLHKKMILQDVKPTDALQAGIKILCDINLEEQKIREKIKKKKNELKLMERKLQEIKEEKEKKKKLEEKASPEGLLKQDKVFISEHPLDDYPHAYKNLKSREVTPEVYQKIRKKIMEGEG